MNKLNSMLLSALCLVLCVLNGCSTTPNANQQAGITVLVDVAVATAVQNGARADQILSIAKQLKALDAGAVADLPAITAALGPLIAKAALPPAEALAANVLIAALSQVIQQNLGNTSLPTSAAIQLVLDDIISAASVYVPVTPAT